MKMSVTLHTCPACRGEMDLTKARISDERLYAPCQQCGRESVIREASCMASAPVPYEKSLGAVKAITKYLKTVCFGPKKPCPDPARYLFVRKNPNAFHVYDLMTYCRKHGLYKGPSVCEKASFDEGGPPA